ncbi:hypothetical protein [Arthrobacter sp. KK5.5]|uniref:hypothetical protein n=1 Tax=Arthrobacter sp. KK5.5 TaxID=3373084 RepID=UPI003EE6293E
MEEASSESHAIVAWGDESMRTVGVKTPLYLLGAALADAPSADIARESMRGVHKSGLKLHWRELEHKDKLQSVQAIANLRLDHIVIAASPLDPKRQERARAKCLERLCWEIEGRGGKSLFLEARTDSLNKRDRALIPRLRGAQALPVGLHVDWLLGSSDPMLWIADQVVGAYGDALAGNDEYLEVVKKDVLIVPIGI